jgi:hypothetical protein
MKNWLRPSDGFAFKALSMPKRADSPDAILVQDPSPLICVSPRRRAEHYHILLYSKLKSIAIILDSSKQVDETLDRKDGFYALQCIRVALKDSCLQKVHHQIPLWILSTVRIA